MDFLWDAITEWLKELLVGGITSNLSGDEAAGETGG